MNYIFNTLQINGDIDILKKSLNFINETKKGFIAPAEIINNNTIEFDTVIYPDFIIKWLSEKFPNIEFHLSFWNEGYDMSCFYDEAIEFGEDDVGTLHHLVFKNGEVIEDYPTAMSDSVVDWIFELKANVKKKHFNKPRAKFNRISHKINKNNDIENLIKVTS